MSGKSEPEPPRSTVRSSTARKRGMRGGNGSALQPLGSPTPVEVRTDGSGRPLALREKGEGKAGAPRRKEVSGRRGVPGRSRRRPLPSWKRVVQIRESWRIDDEWWRRPISRTYHEIVLEEGRVVTLYRDLVEGGWYVQ